MTWVTASVRLLAALLLAAILGWFYGFPLEAVTVALALVVAAWLYQIQRVQHWLQDPQQPPPDIGGIWGDVIARISLQQRKHREVQQRLQSSVDYLQDSLSSMRDGVVMVDEQGVIQWFNRAVESLLDLRYPEDAGQNLTNLVRSPEFNRYFLEGDYAEPLKYSVLGQRSADLRLEVTYFGEGARLLFVRDVSSAVRMEQIRRDFVANVSHELRTPLTVISGYLDTFLASQADFPQRYAKPIKQMQDQALRMESLLQDLLWLSRIESEKSEEKGGLVDVRVLLKALYDEISAVHPHSLLELHLETDRKVYGDYQELYSAASNLINNAIKYGGGQPVSVTWRYASQFCTLEVADKGVGVDAALIPRLTERFYRVDESRYSGTGGTGLGLAIVKHVAQAHHAELEIESELGKGSTFTLKIPVGGT